MELPKLTVLDNDRRKAVSCSARPDRCVKCPANKTNGGRCGGCTADKLKTCQQEVCYVDCNTCVGYKVQVPAICVKAPLRSTYMTLVTNGSPEWARAEYKFWPQPRIQHAVKAVTVARGGGVKSTKNSPYPEEMEVVATTLPDVWGRKGWFSKDLKDYLRLRKHQKLMLLTTMRDDVLEDAWDMEEFGDTWNEVGVDYSMPLAFSTYTNSGHLQNYWSVLRTMYATQRGHSTFAMLARVRGLDLDDYYVAAAKALKQCVMNAQFLVNEAQMRDFIAAVQRWDQLMPEKIAFWFIGMATPTFIHNVRKYAPKRDLYFVSANAFRLAGHGKRLFENGKVRKVPKMSKSELMYENQRAFIAQVEKYGGVK